MEVSDLFIFKENFAKKDRVYTLSFKMPAATDFGLYFEDQPFEYVSEEDDQLLLQHFDGLFNSGRFVSLFDRPYELCEDIESAVEDFRHGQKPPQLLGSWEYSRKIRQISLVWKVPEWFEGGEKFGAGDPQEFRDFCKDWYMEIDTDGSEDDD